MTEHERRVLFDSLYAEYDRRVLAYCLYVIGDRDLANDVFQEAFIKAYTMLHTLRDPEKGANWLFRIARNECLNAMKARQRSERRSVHIDDDFEHARLTTPPADSFDQTGHLEWGLAQLTAEHREALLLAEFEGFSLKEIAEMTGATVSNVKVRIHRAKMKLQKLLQPILQEHD
jgi:RNA polymerase sigma-70 factor, ECF subfamily